MNETQGLYPMMARLDGKTCVVVGGGPVGWRKAAGLLACGARTIVVAPHAVPALAEAARDGRLVWHRRAFAPGDLAGAALAFAATDDAATNALVRAEASREGVWLNAAYEAGEGDFVVPSAVRRGKLLLAATTSGASPLLARRIASEWEETYGAEYAAYVELLERLRRAVQASGADPGRKAAALGRLLDAGALERLRAGESPAAVEADCLALAARWLQGENGNNP
ncbi:precorrin-2 dehydrogenase/sirohydrochlorin ferrochelatase family protein [Paenibacillus sp.]|uniref:precorrin-2 dehydrogenase/sirohydrochlorin ferrochelatase family protein n=1 Tax=Paenibacillus sp. TaxID=58172 RepID=UPI002D5635F1|nr:NAD(P)-dependent oxidoreductase [Paenibacillus sp.]HZG87073.1 NAD(P)-dependent oxidoreductase [Paenibacillus sp.]